MKARTDGELANAHFELAEFMGMAIQTIKDREKVYRGLWIDGGVESNMFHAKQKAVRLWRNYVDHGGALPDNFMDDALDMINYTVFAMYCYKYGLLKGEEDDGELA